MIVYSKLASWCHPGAAWFDDALRDYAAGLLGGAPRRFLSWALHRPGAWMRLPDYDWIALRAWAERRPGWRNGDGAAALLAVALTRSWLRALRPLGVEPELVR